MDKSATDELTAITIDYHQVRRYYADALRGRSHPMPDKLPDEGDTAGLKSRNDVLAVQKPFYSPFMQILSGGPSEGQKLSDGFQTKYCAARRRLEDYCYIHDRKELLSALRNTDVTAANGEWILNALDRHIYMLVRTLPPKDQLRIRLDVDFPNALVEARGQMTQPHAVKEVNRLLAAHNETVSLDSYKGWEAGRHTPQGNNRTAAEDFIRARLG